MARHSMDAFGQILTEIRDVLEDIKDLKQDATEREPAVLMPLPPCHAARYMWKARLGTGISLYYGHARPCGRILRWKI